MNKEEIFNIFYGKQTWDIWRNFEEIESSIDESEMLYEYFDDIKKCYLMNLHLMIKIVLHQKD